MLETPGKMHMYDMVNIDTIVFKIVMLPSKNGESSKKKKFP